MYGIEGIDLSSISCARCEAGSSVTKAASFLLGRISCKALIYIVRIDAASTEKHF